MDIVQRQTAIFFLPLSMEAIKDHYSSYSVSAETLAPETPTGKRGATWSKRQLYINPQSFSVTDNKLVQKQLTKGGHLVQYWGEDLTTITMSGTTGSSGVEGINILRDIYRHEQLHYRKVLSDRKREMAIAAKQASEKAEEQIYEGNAGGFLAGAADALTGGGFTKAVSGLSNSIDILFGTELGSNYGGTGGAVSVVPTLAAFATNIDLYFQGEFFRGYFTNFTVSESAQEPGHFTYNLNFTVTRRSGKRFNFMPWHRNPLEYDGETVMSQSVTEAKGSFPGVDRLSFKTNSDTWNGDPDQYADMLAKENMQNSLETSKFKDEISEREALQPNKVDFRRKTIKS